MVQTQRALIEQLKQTFIALHDREPAGHVELRALGKLGPVLAGCFTNAGAFAAEAARLDQLETRNLYLTLNPIRLKEGMNEGVCTAVGNGQGASDSDVLVLCNLLLDFDPVRPSGVCATDTEKRNARDRMEVVREYLNSLGWPEPIVADSGNGYHLLYRIDLPNTEENATLLKEVIRSISARYSTAEVGVDKSVWNPARITRLYGTVNRKGAHSEERPWRRSSIEHIPETRLCVTADQLRAVVETHSPSTRQPRQQLTAQPAGLAMSFNMEGFLRAAGIAYEPGASYCGGMRWVLKACPFNYSHDRGEVAVFLDGDGRPGFNCFHSSCQEYAGWAAFEREFKSRLEELGDVETLEAIQAFENPIGFVNLPNGLYWIAPPGPRSPRRTEMRIGDPLQIVARVRTEESQGWGVALRWVARDGTRKDLVVSSSELVTDAKTVLAQLADGGYVSVVQGAAKDKLVEYLLNYPAPSARRADQVGWCGPAYVFPDEVIGQPPEPVHYVSRSRAAAAYGTAGTIDEWTQNVGRYCAGNSRLVLGVCAAFSGPLLALTGNETGGIHLRATTSRGKTTALQVAASVCGGGGTTGYVRQWRATGNGLEGAASAHNDGLLVLDELAQASGKEVSDVIYMLANQAGKLRATKNGGIADVREWRLMVLSSGEVSIAEHARDSGKKIKGGVEVRFLDIPADSGCGMGLFENIHQFSTPAEFADYLKSSTKRYYGTALRAWVHWVCSNRTSVIAEALRLQEEFVLANTPIEAEGEVTRALRRFGLLGAAGELATRPGLTGWEPGEATAQVKRCLESWLSERGGAGSSDLEKGITQVLSFIEQGGARFQAMDSDFAPRDRLGFRRRLAHEMQFLILTDVFKDVLCSGFDYKAIRKEMIARGLLLPGTEGHPGQEQVRVPHLGRRWVYVLPTDDADFEPVTDSEDSGRADAA